MKVSVEVDKDLVHIAQKVTNVKKKSMLINCALKALIEKESAQKLASMGGSMPFMKRMPSRHRF